MRSKVSEKITTLPLNAAAHWDYYHIEGKNIWLSRFTYVFNFVYLKEFYQPNSPPDDIAASTDDIHPSNIYLIDNFLNIAYAKNQVFLVFKVVLLRFFPIKPFSRKSWELVGSSKSKNQFIF